MKDKSKEEIEAFKEAFILSELKSWETIDDTVLMLSGFADIEDIAVKLGNLRKLEK